MCFTYETVPMRLRQGTRVCRQAVADVEELKNKMRMRLFSNLDLVNNRVYSLNISLKSGLS